ncbi:MAG: adenylyl-sulfate kinase [Crocinitomix sp.]|nr:adenylyl-sulfate kinase [Crocinitomix sp.]
MKSNQVFWITGLSGAGKTSVAMEAVEQLKDSGHDFVLLDGDVVRNGLCKDLGFSIEDRQENIRRVAEVSKLFIQNGQSCICTFISPTNAIRNMAAEIIGVDFFNEVYINTPLAICETRDPKGLYKKVRKGEIPNFTGISSVYEIPENPDLILDCYNHFLSKSVKELMEFITLKIQ